MQIFSSVQTTFRTILYLSYLVTSNNVDKWIICVYFFSELLQEIDILKEIYIDELYIDTYTRL